MFCLEVCPAEGENYLLFLRRDVFLAVFLLLEEALFLFLAGIGFCNAMMLVSHRPSLLVLFHLRKLMSTPLEDTSSPQNTKPSIL